ncbi:MAG TPA: glycosyltransferase family A protein [Vicinamibacterales bacterium]|jgi:glycosyltransferase involved in cell wall biosynthesis
MDQPVCLTARLPMVSIIVPAYNASATISETMASIFAQTRRDFEVIVIDDGSTDRPALDTSLAPWRAGVRLLDQPNRGAGAARNQGLLHARGRYVAFLDADDMWMPAFLETLAGYLDRHADCDLVWSDGWVCGETALAGRRFLETTGMGDDPSFEALLSERCTVLTSAVVGRRQIVDAVGRFDARLRRGQDFDLWIRLAHKGARMAVLREPLMVRRVFSTGLSGDSVAELRRGIAVLLGIARKLPLDVQELGVLYRRLALLADRLEIELAKQALGRRDVTTARSHLQQASAIRSWKVRMARVGLRVAPHLVQRAYDYVRPMGGAMPFEAGSQELEARS